MWPPTWLLLFLCILYLFTTLYNILLSYLFLCSDSKYLLPVFDFMEPILAQVFLAWNKLFPFSFTINEKRNLYKYWWFRVIGRGSYSQMTWQMYPFPPRPSPMHSLIRPFRPKQFSWLLLSEIIFAVELYVSRITLDAFLSCYLCLSDGVWSSSSTLLPWYLQLAITSVLC